MTDVYERCLLHTSYSMTWIPSPKMTNFYIFIIPLHYFQGALIWLGILKEIMKQVGLKDFLKKHRDISSTITTTEIEVFVELVSSFQLLTNFTKNTSIGDMGVLNAPLEYYNVFWNSCKWSNQVLQTRHLYLILWFKFWFFMRARDIRLLSKTAFVYIWIFWFIPGP